MSDRSKNPNSNDEKKALEEMDEPGGQGSKEALPTQGLKTPPRIEFGEDSGEWTRGGGSDPNETNKGS
jgi:hypothetical protein